MTSPLSGPTLIWSMFPRYVLTATAALYDSTAATGASATGNSGSVGTGSVAVTGTFAATATSKSSGAAILGSIGTARTRFLGGILITLISLQI